MSVYTRNILEIGAHYFNPCSELLELREDEKMALESIYGPAFIVKIPNKGEQCIFYL